MMKIYTRTGDEGLTGLFGGGRVSKNDVRLHAYGTIDELNSLLGVVDAAGGSELQREAIRRVQNDLFTIGSDLATPLDSQAKWVVRISEDMVRRLEAEIDQWDAELPPLKNFILPGGSVAGAFLHQARTVCRRAERWIVALRDVGDGVNPVALQYVNRLSDWLFVLARIVNQAEAAQETVWRAPGR